MTECSHPRWVDVLPEDDAPITEVTCTRCGATKPKVGPWRPGNNGAGKRIWFLHRDAPEIADRYRFDSRGVLIRYASHETAAKAAEKLNNLDYGSDIIKVMR